MARRDAKCLIVFDAVRIDSRKRNMSEMIENKISGEIVDAAVRMHSTLGLGLF